LRELPNTEETAWPGRVAGGQRLVLGSKTQFELTMLVLSISMSSYCRVILAGEDGARELMRRSPTK